MALTAVDICNRALLRIGEKQTISALDDASVGAQVCSAIYEQCRDELLASFPWPFASKHGLLAALLTTKRSGWTFAYSAPPDMVEARYIYAGYRRGAPIGGAGVFGPCYFGAAPLPLGGVGKDIAFTVESNDTGDGRIILTDQPSAELIYTALISSEAAYPPLFVNALAWKLASELALAIPIKAQLADWAEKRFDVAMAKAGAQAFRESTEDIQPDSEFISVRG